MNRLLYSDNYNSFEEWYELAKNKKQVYPFCAIPYEEWVQAYIDKIEDKSDEEVYDLVRLLLKPFTRIIDRELFQIYHMVHIEKRSDLPDVYKNMNFHEYNRRIENGQEAWEGLTWIVEFLPNSPFKAIKALNTYFVYT